MADANEAERVAEARARITETTPAAAIARRSAGNVTFLDVRENNEWNLFRIPGAVHVPLGTLAEKAADAVPRDRDVIVYCNAGSRSILATDQLRAMGFTRVASLAGGVRAWMDAGGELED
jgi:rhodanese-related sulfurtransferase